MYCEGLGSPTIQVILFPLENSSNLISKGEFTTGFVSSTTVNDSSYESIIESLNTIIHPLNSTPLELNDTDLGLLDIESAWFYEDTSEPEYLYIALKIKELKENFNAVFSIRWTYDNVKYVAGLDTFFYKSKVFRSGLYQKGTYWQWKSMPECKGTFDQESNIITWKIQKSFIGDPKEGDILTNTKANAVPGFPLSFILFFIHDYRDFAPNDYDDFGQDYIIEY